MGSSGILWVYGKGELGVACAVEQDVEDLVEMVGVRGPHLVCMAEFWFCECNAIPQSQHASPSV